MIKSFESDCQYIINAAHNFAVKNPDFTSDVGHIDNFPGAAVYVRDAAKISSYLLPGSRILDWGCGYGQLSYLLAKNGYQVDACDWSKDLKIPEFLDSGINYFPLTSPVQIHVPDASFDVVISSGTLEHAHNIIDSLKEIRRILKPGGWFFIFRFPAEYSISEYIARKSGRWSHAVRMSKSELQFMLRMFSFRVDQIGYDSFLPIFLGRQLKFLRPIREQLDTPITYLDKVLTSLPIISAFSTSIYCFAQINTEYTENF
ncbi:class I SAM-dependent methyltransferase [Aphanizomenon flos-aquae NRERC-008]|uniref:Class I SAM-dependent methyltransferase n=3 Tax=Aphanizomenonaceae TaxID=1892259 RepID=A0ABY5M3A3_9CYAN|nr:MULTISPECIES: class I SAM-dependent methyltransferase [Aphanizomenonaceae]MDK2409162.1 class I SAM-dependent methyltransferase [Aphanizomenon sp. 202]MDK2459966.1 class I SAM-dependent methyltransferase [Aphanizomenon sp. PH219]MBD2632689.1 class I SAM-dependent methyltransferase [Aphanizomenon sp. FACHB-1399]MBD2643508.1 class I SAM-dependent methyltransferase [Aphanizomenon sp. FACHB-1401]MBD2674069.1 class I SAM-dependent methyltransferase [Aphanizomenon flos-aquae FACHB-1416]